MHRLELLSLNPMAYSEDAEKPAGLGPVRTAT